MGCQSDCRQSCQYCRLPPAGSVPSGIALHDRLEALDLRNNRLDTIPPEWTNAPNTLVAQAPLVYLRIAGNQFTVRLYSGCRALSAHFLCRYMWMLSKPPHVCDCQRKAVFAAGMLRLNGESAIFLVTFCHRPLQANFPTTFARLPKLAVLDMKNNKFKCVPVRRQVLETPDASSLQTKLYII